MANNPSDQLDVMEMEVHKLQKQRDNLAHLVAYADARDAAERRAKTQANMLVAQIANQFHRLTRNLESLQANVVVRQYRPAVPTVGRDREQAETDHARTSAL